MIGRSRSAARRHTSHHRSTASRHRSMTSRHRRTGPSNAHAFAVGRATGVNINGSAMGAAGAAQHRSIQSSRKRRKHSSTLHRSNSSHHSYSSNNGINIKSVTATQKAIVAFGGIFALFTIMSIVIFMLLVVGFIYFILPHLR